MDSDILLDMLTHHNDQLDGISLSSPCMQLKGTATSSAFCLHQQRTLEVIQLIEVPAPPPADYSYSHASSSVATSSTCSSSADEEESCSSYCSSDPDVMQSERTSTFDDTYKTRLSRILLWRENFSKAMGTPLSPPPIQSSILKRKVDDECEPVEELDDDVSSRCSKRSRMSDSPRRARSAWQHRRFSAHSCPACDTPFATRQSLLEHGRDARLNDACREAVEYGLES